MIFKKTRINVVDTSGYLSGRVFHTYSKKSYIIGNGFVYTSIRDAYLRLQHHIGNKRKMFILYTRKNKKCSDSSNINFHSNSGVVLKKRTSTVGKFTKGPLRYSLKRRKLSSSFSTVI